MEKDEKLVKARRFAEAIADTIPDQNYPLLTGLVSLVKDEGLLCPCPIATYLGVALLPKELRSEFIVQVEAALIAGTGHMTALFMAFAEMGAAINAAIIKAGGPECWAALVKNGVEAREAADDGTD